MKGNGERERKLVSLHGDKAWGRVGGEAIKGNERRAEICDEYKVKWFSFYFIWIEHADSVAGSWQRSGNNGKTFFHFDPFTLFSATLFFIRRVYANYLNSTAAGPLLIAPSTVTLIKIVCLTFKVYRGVSSKSNKHPSGGWEWELNCVCKRHENARHETSYNFISLGTHTEFFIIFFN